MTWLWCWVLHRQKSLTFSSESVKVCKKTCHFMRPNGIFVLHFWLNNWSAYQSGEKPLKCTHHVWCWDLPSNVRATKQFFNQKCLLFLFKSKMHGQKHSKNGIIWLCSVSERFYALHWARKWNTQYAMPLLVRSCHFWDHSV